MEWKLAKNFGEKRPRIRFLILNFMRMNTENVLRIIARQRYVDPNMFIDIGCVWVDMFDATGIDLVAKLETIPVERRREILDQGRKEGWKEPSGYVLTGPKPLSLYFI